MNGPVVDSFHLPLIQRDTINYTIVDDVFKEMDLGLVEQALLSLKKQVEISSGPPQHVDDVRPGFGSVSKCHLCKLLHGEGIPGPPLA